MISWGRKHPPPPPALEFYDATLYLPYSGQEGHDSHRVMTTPQPPLMYMSLLCSCTYPIAARKVMTATVSPPSPLWMSMSLLCTYPIAARKAMTATVLPRLQAVLESFIMHT